jgi:hypothetical protein
MFLLARARDYLTTSTRIRVFDALIRSATVLSDLVTRVRIHSRPGANLTNRVPSFHSSFLRPSAFG